MPDAVKDLHEITAKLKISPYFAFNSVKFHPNPKKYPHLCPTFTNFMGTNK